MIPETIREESDDCPICIDFDHSRSFDFFLQEAISIYCQLEWLFLSFDGTGVHAYVIDTGIRASHNEFTGRVGNGTDTVDNDSDPSDCNGHGTHVAGTIGGTVYSVAKNVTLHSVGVLNCGGSGTTSGVVAGVDWVTANHVSPAVANMSLGGSASSTLDAAVENSVAAGRFVRGLLRWAVR